MRVLRLHSLCPAGLACQWRSCWPGCIFNTLPSMQTGGLSRLVARVVASTPTPPNPNGIQRRCTGLALTRARDGPHQLLFRIVHPDLRDDSITTQTRRSSDQRQFFLLF